MKEGLVEDILAEGDRDRELWQALTPQHDTGFLEGPGCLEGEVLGPSL